MKNLFIIALLFLGLTANASDLLNLSISAENEIVTVSYKNIINTSKLKLIDNEGNVLFNETVEPAGYYKRSFNINNLPDGEYLVALENTSSISYATIKKGINGIEMISDPKNNVVFKPSYKVEDKMVMLSVTNPETTKANISVYNKDGVLVGSTTSRELIVKASFNFAEAPAGNYIITVAINNEIFTHEIEL